MDDPKSDSSVFWLQQITSESSSYNNIEFDNTYLHDFTGLLANVAATDTDSTIDGFVRYDPSTNSTNAALIACAASDANLLAVGSATMASYLSDKLGIPMAADVSNSTPYV